jgi:hypothetical protein
MYTRHNICFFAFSKDFLMSKTEYHEILWKIVYLVQIVLLCPLFFM